MKKFVFDVDNSNQVLAWQVLDNLDLKDMPAILHSIRHAIENMEKGQIKLLVDNRYMMKGDRPIVFSPAVNEQWEDLQRWLLGYCQKVAVLCNGPTMKMQMDRLAKNTTMINIYKPFWSTDSNQMKQEAYDYLGIPSNALIDSVVEIS